MEKVAQKLMISRKRAMIKASLLVAFIVAAIIIVQFTPVKGFLRQESLGRLLNAAGFWAPFAFILVYIAGI